MAKDTEPPEKKYPYYVTATDKFMSGWGHAEGKTNKLVFCCTSYDQAEQVARNLTKRTEMKNISIRSSRPYYNEYAYLMQWFTREKEPNWYLKHPPWEKSAEKRPPEGVRGVRR